MDDAFIEWLLYGNLFHETADITYLENNLIWLLMTQLSCILSQETKTNDYNNHKNNQFINVNFNQNWKISQNQLNVAETPAKNQRRKLSVMAKSRTNKNVLSLIPNENLPNLNVKRSLNLSNSLNRANQIKEDEMEEAKNKNLVLTIPNEKYADQQTTQNLTIPPICKKKGRVIKRRHSKLLLRMCSRNLKGKDKSAFNSQVEGNTVKPFVQSPPKRPRSFQFWEGDWTKGIIVLDILIYLLIFFI